MEGRVRIGKAMGGKSRKKAFFPLVGQSGFRVGVFAEKRQNWARVERTTRCKTAVLAPATPNMDRLGKRSGWSGENRGSNPLSGGVD
jgi:hypothetical protein